MTYLREITHFLLDVNCNPILSAPHLRAYVCGKSCRTVSGMGTFYGKMTSVLLTFRTMIASRYANHKYHVTMENDLVITKLRQNKVNYFVSKLFFILYDSLTIVRLKLSEKIWNKEKTKQNQSITPCKGYVTLSYTAITTITWPWKRTLRSQNDVKSYHSK